MENPLLAGLHFDRALELDRNCADAAALKKSLHFRAATVANGRELGDKGESAPASSPLFPPPSKLGSPVEMRDTRHARATANLTTTAPSGSVEAAECATAAESGVRPDRPQDALFRRAIATACEEYRAGVVLHQEAFLASSREKFCHVLALIEEAQTAAQIAQRGENLGDSVAETADGGSPVKFLSDGGSAAVRTVRVGCHLNIAAAALLRKTDYDSAVDHCTR